MSGPKCVNRFSVCRDVLAMIAEFCKRQPYDQVVGIMNALNSDPIPLDPETGLAMQPPKMMNIDPAKQGGPKEEDA